MVADIDAALWAIGSLSAPGDACSQDQITADIADRVGLSSDGFGSNISRGGAAYETYADLAERLGSLSPMILQGEVLDHDGRPAARSCRSASAAKPSCAVARHGRPIATARAQTPAGAGAAETFDVAI